MEEVIEPWETSRYSCKVAKTPNRKSIHGGWFKEIEVDLQDVVFENLVGDAIQDIEMIIGKKLIERDPLGDSLLLPTAIGYHGPVGLAKFFAGSGYRSVVLRYLGFKKEVMTEQIKEDPFFEGRFYPNEFFDNEYVDPFDIIQQKLNGNLMFWRFLDDMIMKLSVELEPEEQLAVEKISRESTYVSTKDESERAFLTKLNAAISQKGISFPIFRDQKPETKRQDTTRPNQAVLALYYRYLVETGCMAALENMPGGKIAFLKEAVKEWGLDSWKSLQTKYNEARLPIDRISPKNAVANIEAAIKMLDEYPKAKELAKTELSIANLRNK